MPEQGNVHVAQVVDADAPLRFPGRRGIEPLPIQRPAPLEGYRDAIAAHRATWTTTQQHTSPEIQAAAKRQLRERIREPE